MDSAPANRACDRWRAVGTTDSIEGMEGAVDHYERVVQAPAGMPADEVFRTLEERLLRYEIFPLEIMKSVVCSEDGLIAEGTTLLQRVPIGPITLNVAVRVVRLWRMHSEGVDEVGFTYATLQGHPERGVSSFALRRDKPTDRVTFAIDVRSRPGSLFTRLGRPIARRFQRKATEAALAHFASVPD